MSEERHNEEERRLTRMVPFFGCDECDDEGEEKGTYVLWFCVEKL